MDTNPANLFLEITTSGPDAYTISYDGNGHTGGSAPSAQTKALGQDLTLSANTGSLVKTGHSFVGWNTSADGSGTSYAEGTSYSAEGDVTLYAMWQSPFQIWTTANGGGSETFSGDSNNDGIADGMAWLLDSATPASPAQSLLPDLERSTGGLVSNFRMLKSTARRKRPAQAAIQQGPRGYRRLGQPHHHHSRCQRHGGRSETVLTPHATEDYQQVQATIPASAAEGGAKLFMRLLAEHD